MLINGFIFGLGVGLSLSTVFILFSHLDEWIKVCMWEYYEAKRKRKGASNVTG